MNGPRLSSENLHASTVAIDGRAVMITGPSGSGKSDLALRLIDRGFSLVSDDRTIIHKADGKLIASAPDTIVGKLEIRGIGIVEMPSTANVPLALIVELSDNLTRMPDDSRQRLILGLTVPLVSVDGQTASAAAKVVFALNRLGLAS